MREEIGIDCKVSFDVESTEAPAFEVDPLLMDPWWPDGFDTRAYAHLLEGGLAEALAEAAKITGGGRYGGFWRGDKSIRLRPPRG